MGSEPNKYSLSFNKPTDFSIVVQKFLKQIEPLKIKITNGKVTKDVRLSATGNYV